MQLEGSVPRRSLVVVKNRTVAVCGASWANDKINGGGNAIGDVGALWGLCVSDKIVGGGMASKLNM